MSVQESVSSITDIDSEYELLGSLIVHPDYLSHAREIVSESDFWLHKNGSLFRVMNQIWSNGDKDAKAFPVVLRNKLRDIGILESSMGGNQGLADLIDGCTGTASIKYCAARVAERSKARDLIELCESTKKSLFDPLKKSGEIASDAMEAIQRINVEPEHQGAIHISDVIKDVHDSLVTQSQDGVTPGIPTGFMALDEMLTDGGLSPGQLVVLGARPSVGKTALATDIARNAAIAGTSVMMFCVEMAKEEIAKRIISAMTRISSMEMKYRLNQSDLDSISDISLKLAETKLFIDDDESLSIDNMHSRLSKAIDRHGIQLVIVDYLQLMQTKGKENRNVEVSELSRSLKLMAREFNVAILCLSQLNRSVEARTDHKPKISDLRDSGAIEQDADIVLLLHRPQKEDPLQPLGKTDLIMDKQRNGPIGTIGIQFMSRLAMFKDMISEQEPDVQI